MDFETDNFKDQLLESIHSRNETLFEYILNEMNINPDVELKCLNGLSILQKVLTMPNSKSIIDVCIYHGFNFFKKTDAKPYPLHYAIESLSVENLRVILQPSLRKLSSSDIFEGVQYCKVINEKSRVFGNHLHFLIHKLTEENYAEVSEMIKTLVDNQCSVNALNDHNETPFYLMLKNQFVQIDLIKYVVDNTVIDNHSHRGDEITSLMEEKGLRSNQIEKVETTVAFVRQHLGDWDASLFGTHLAMLQKTSPNFKNDMVMLLEQAILKNSPEIVRILMEYGVDINEVPANGKSQLNPAFLACTLGHYQALKLLLADQNVSFAPIKLRRNRGSTLLHQIFAFDLVNVTDRQRCFKLIVADSRCTLDIINRSDDAKLVPLHYSCKFGCNEISKELLRRGAYIGHESVINFIRKDVLEEFLDGRIKWSGNIDDSDFELSVDYKFLTPPDQSKLEITAAHLLASDSILQNLALHPVISSFVLLKWKKISDFVYASVLIYFGFLLLLGWTIMNFYNVFDSYGVSKDFCETLDNKLKNELFDISLSKFQSYSDQNSVWLLENLEEIKRFYQDSSAVEKRLDDTDTFVVKYSFKSKFDQYMNDYWPLYWMGIFGIVLMTAYELVQFKMSWKNYFFKLSNWIDILFIGYSISVLLGRKGVSPDGFQKTCAIMILLMGGLCISLFSKVSVFSLSLHLAILRRLVITFLKTMAPYLVIILAFGISFYALNFRSKGEVISTYDGFANIFISTVSTVRMMLSDFGSVVVQKHEYFKGFLLLGFMVVISIIVFNLLNALAISDTSEMMEVAELVETTRQISTLRTYDSLFSRLKTTYCDVFPKINTIILKPHSSNVVRIKLGYRKSDSVSIPMRNAAAAAKIDYLFHTNSLNFWKSVPDPVEFDEKIIKKFVDHVKNRQAKQLDEMERMRNSQALESLRESLIILRSKLDGKIEGLSSQIEI